MKKRLSLWTFYKKKGFYIILTVLFSLILLADLAIAVFVPAQTRGFGGMTGGFPQGFESMETEEGGADSGGSADDESDSSESENGESENSGMIRPERGQGVPEGQGMPEGMEAPEDMEMPEGMDAPEDMEIPENMEIPDGFETARTSSGILQFIKSYWMLIFVIFAILDALSIFMWIRISKKKKKQELLEMQAWTEKNGEISLVHKPVKKEKHNQFVGIIILAAMVLLIVVVKILTSQNGNETPRTEATAHSGTAEIGTINSVLPGAGTLEEEEAEVLELPAEVEITEWYVSNGDIVTEGDKLGLVDSVSVMSAIVAVQEKMVALDEEMQEHEDAEISDTITAGADGRIKKIYAEEDTGVVETMYESGALVLISLDGMMAVSIPYETVRNTSDAGYPEGMETEAQLAAGDIVTVTLSDGTGISGKVESVIDGTVVVTVSDEESDFGDSVTVTAEDGTEIGSGELYIHSELKVTGFTGTVSEVEVSVDEEVSSGKTLLTLTDTDYTGEYEVLLEQRGELEEQMQELFQLYQDQHIYASCTGVISGLDETLVTADTDEVVSIEGEGAEEATTEEATIEDENLEETAVEEVTETAVGTTTVAGSPYNKVSGAVMMMSYSSNLDSMRMMTTTASQTVSKEVWDTGNITVPDVGTTNNPETGVTSGKGTGTAPDLGTTSDSGTTPDSGTETNPGTTPDPGITPDSGTETNPGATLDPEAPADPGVEVTPGSDSSYTSYIGTVSAVSPGEGTITIDLLSVNGSVRQLVVSSSLHVYAFADGRYMAGTALDIKTGDTLMLVYDGGTAPAFCIRITVSSSENADDFSNMQGSIGQQFPSSSSGMANVGLSGSGSQEVYNEVMDELEEEVENDYGVTTTTWLSVTPQDTMEVTITVDEMDILSLKEGQEALVTLDAFPGQSFRGTVTMVHLNGTNSGGSSKYEAVVSIAREENMLAGMNASVQITVDTKEGVLIIPEAALVEQESSVFVYTSYDEKTESFGNLVEVTTGISDGENVEILSGLEEGSEYWYSYLDVVNYTSFFSSNNGGFSIGSMFGGRGGR